MKAQCNIDGCERKHVYAVSIDCADCARKVENALKEHKDVSEASYDFPKGRLTVHSRLSDEEIKNIARSAEDEIEFLERLSSLMRKRMETGMYSQSRLTVQTVRERSKTHLTSMKELILPSLISRGENLPCSLPYLITR